ncbi:MAG: Hsp20/alpha crystallin family protein [Cytophagales bacterium]|nr:Hsp20/alpha crystallin family protein [Cytophagales bacterium]MDW8385074.1 Hsp20/alpha crystallin family protein [Flammeovirgaceae bacterium]
MSLMKISPYSLFNQLVNDFFNTWDKTINQSSQESQEIRYVIPAVNISETDDSYAIEVAVPGIKKEDFQLELENNTLVVKSSKKEENTKKQDKYTVREFNYTSFYRSFNLPDTIDTEKISAQYENGVLHIKLPKLPSKISKVKTIAIQ